MSKVITLAQLAEHNSESDCFMAIHGSVYDVTKFLDEVRTDERSVGEQNNGQGRQHADS